MEPLHGVRALVVDPSDDEREMLATYLQLAGAEPTAVATAGHAAAALEECEFDVAIVDLGPESEDPCSVVADAGLHRCGLKVATVAISASLTHAEITRARDAGFDVLLFKPFLLPQLGRILEELTASAGAGPH